MDCRDLQEDVPVNKDKLLALLYNYYLISKELKTLQKEIPSQKEKKVRFSPEIEQILETNTSCACNLKCSLNPRTNIWYIRRKSVDM